VYTLSYKGIKNNMSIPLAVIVRYIDCTEECNRNPLGIKLMVSPCSSSITTDDIREALHKKYNRETLAIERCGTLTNIISEKSEIQKYSSFRVVLDGCCSECSDTLLTNNISEKKEKEDEFYL